MQSAKTNAAVATYYTESEIDYRLAWHLASELCMHYGFWGKGVRTLRAAFAHENAVLAQMARIGKDDYVLDAGCGVGGSSLYLAKTIGCRVTGITITPSQVPTAAAAANQRGLSPLTNFQVADFTNMPFADESFSVVWAVESVCYATEKQDFLDEAFRVLKPSGRLILADGFATKTNYVGEEARLMQGWLDGWRVPSLSTPRAFCNKAKKAGFEDVKYRDHTAKVMPTATRMYRYWQLGRPYDWATRRLGLRSEVAKDNFEGAYYQYHLLRSGLATYGVISASKPH